MTTNIKPQGEKAFGWPNAACYGNPRNVLREYPDIPIVDDEI